MRLKADKEVKEGRLAAATMGDIDAKARAQYEDDLRDAHKTSLDTAGVWVCACSGTADMPLVDQGGCSGFRV